MSKKCKIKTDHGGRGVDVYGAIMGQGEDCSRICLGSSDKKYISQSKTSANGNLGYTLPCIHIHPSLTLSTHRRAKGRRGFGGGEGYGLS